MLAGTAASPECPSATCELLKTNRLPEDRFAATISV